MTNVVSDNKGEYVRVQEWRVQWLRAGGYTKKNATLIAKSNIDWRYANDVLLHAKEKGYDEKFVMNLIHD
jgi:hypothetical protein